MGMVPSWGKGDTGIGGVTYLLSLVTSIPRWSLGAFPALEERGKQGLSRARWDPRAPRGEGGTHRPPGCSDAPDHALVASRTLQGEHGKGQFPPQSTLELPSMAGMLLGVFSMGSAAPRHPHSPSHPWVLPCQDNP